MLRKLPLLVFVCAIYLWAADFWVSKPFTDWSDKEIQTILSKSPWVKQKSVSMSVAGPAGGGAPSGGRGGRGGGGGRGASGPQGDGVSADPGIDGAGGGFGGGAVGGGAPEYPIVLVWATALPMKQAQAKLRYKNEAGTSAEAQAFLNREEMSSILRITGLPNVRQLSVVPDAKKMIIDATTLTVKGKDPVRPIDVQISGGAPAGDAKGGRGGFGAPADLFLVFPHAPFSAEDKEMELSTKIGTISFKQKFDLKDMVYKGKLEM